ncbi:MAG: heparinase II/III family protein [Lachnospiraceae bacterium]
MTSDFTWDSIRSTIAKHSYLSKLTEQDKTLIKNQYPAEWKAYLDEADLVVDHKFSFIDPWDMEQCQEIYHFEKEIDWNFSANGDPEWIYMLNRHRFLVSLAKAYAISGDKKYAAGFLDLILDWIEKNPLNSITMKSSWRTIDVGVRLWHWLEAIPFFLNDINDEDLLQVMKSIQLQGDYLYSNNQWNKIHSNWGVIENTGLFALAAKYDFMDTDRKWYHSAKQFLIECLKVQILPDGMHWEQLSSYHYEVMLCVLNVLMTQYLSDEEMDATFLIYLEQMMLAASVWMQPDGYQVCMGDSDRVYIKVELDLSKWILYGASDASIRKIGEEWGWYFQALRTDQRSKDQRKSILYEPKDVPNYLSDSGHHMLGDRNNSNSPWILFSSGEMGGGHGHMDMLHFNYWYKGRVILGDSGRYTYRDDSVLRKYLKSMEAHNTLSVDEQSFTEYVNTWVYGKVAMPLYHHRKTTTYFDYAESAHDGYLDTVYHARGLLLIGGDILLVMDILKSNGTHRIKRYFNFPEVTVTLEEQKVITELSEDNVILYFNEPSSLESESSYVSPNYNEVKQAVRLTCTNQIDNDQLLSIVIAPADLSIKVERMPVLDRWQKLIPEESGFAIRITSGTKVWIIGNLSLYTEQNNHFYVDGTCYLGRHWIDYKDGDDQRIMSYK